MNVKWNPGVLLPLLLAIAGIGAAQDNPPFGYGPPDAYDPEVSSPQSVLGYKVGEQFTPYYKLERFLHALDRTSGRVQLKRYGETYEGRALYILIISSEENLSSLESIRSRIKKLADPRLLESAEEARRIIADTPAIAWMSYNVHGNESSGTEAAIRVLYQLAAGTDEKTQQLLDELVIIVDPLLNPDGRERYVTFYNRTVGLDPNPNPDAEEHREPSPGSRTNHYFFDLNRDWAWQTQRETRQRIAEYLNWMPQVHGDFHEMGYNSSYFFFPPRQPINQNISPEVVKWTELYGAGNALAFDRYGWAYYTAEGFDLFYPGFGDTWPSFNGAAGMTYEQGGGGSAGLAVRRADGTILTLTDRAWHHFVASMATLETTQQRRQERLGDFLNSRRKSLEDGQKNAISYYLIPPHEDAGRQADFIDLLLRHGIEVFRLQEDFAGKSLESFTEKDTEKTFPAGSFAVPLAQPSQRLLTALFEMEPVLSDTFFYDVSAWSLPVVYGMPTYWTKTKNIGEMMQLSERPQVSGGILGERPSYAYLLPWTQDRAASVLFQLLKNKWRAGVATKPFSLGDTQYGRGTIVVPVNNYLPQSADSTVHYVIAALAEQYGVTFHTTNTGLTKTGSDLGSNAVRALKKPKIALIADSHGALWFMFEQYFDIDFTSLSLSQLTRTNLSQYTVIINPGGRSSMNEAQINRLKDWISAGGTYIGLQRGATFALSENVALSSVKPRQEEKAESKEAKEKQKQEQEKKKRMTVAEREEEGPKQRIPGTIMRLIVDNSHPLGYGYEREIHAPKLSGSVFELSERGYNVAIFADNPKLAGYITEENIKKVAGSAYLVHESHGRGSVILFFENPTYRAFWRGLSRLLLNAVMFGQAM